jgi:hypothetical protein
MNVMHPSPRTISAAPSSAQIQGEVEHARSSLHAAVDSRKSAERDAQLLANRINLLKSEESRAQRLLAMNRERAKEAVNMRRFQLNQELEKKRALESRSVEASTGQERSNYIREVSKANRENIKAELAKSKARQAHETRRALQERIQEKLVEELAERERVSRRTEQIKQDRLEARRRIGEEKLARMNAYKEEYQQRLAREESIKAEAEHRIANLLKEELEIISRLQRAQEEQNKIQENIECLRTAPMTPVRSSPSVKYIRKSDPSPKVVSVTRWDVGGPALR